MPAANPWFTASSGSMPLANDCSANSRAVSGAPSMMLWRIAWKSGSDKVPPAEISLSDQADQSGDCTPGEGQETVTGDTFRSCGAHSITLIDLGSRQTN